MAEPYILLAEDDPDDHETFEQAFLTKIPHGVVVCVNGFGKLEKYLTGCSTADLPSLILMDYDMPPDTADGILGELLSQSPYANIPKLVWSTSDNPLFVHRCLTAGAQHYLRKPSTLRELEAFINTVVSTFRQTID